MRVRAYVIHLRRAEARRGTVERLLEGLPCPAQVLDAVDGAQLGEAAMRAQVSAVPLFRPAYPWLLGLGEIGCFLSHRKAWQAIVDSGEDAGLIIEDDVALTEAFSAAFALAAEFCGRDGYVQFQTRPIRGAWHEVLRQGDVGIVEPVVVQRRTAAQLVGCEAAARLLAASAAIDRPVDVFLQHFWETGQRIHCVEPSGVLDMTAAAGGTTIQSKRRRGLIEALLRPIQRARLRSGLARRSVKARRAME